MTLSALDQHFLAHHYSSQAAAQALASDDSAAYLATTCYGGAGPGRANFDTDRRGIHYTMPGEEEPAHELNAEGRVKRWRRAHRITWTQLRAHRKAQRPELIDQLIEARAARNAEERRYSDAMDAISVHWYGGATDEQRAALDVERAAHYSRSAVLRERVRAAVMAILPLHDVDPDEPTDLIGWAEVLAP